MTPRFALRLEGTDISDPFRDRLLSLVLTDVAGMEADTLVLRLDNRESQIEMPRRGVNLALELGFDGAPMVAMGRFTVQGLSGEGEPDTLTIHAVAADMTGQIRAPRTQTWEGMTFGEIAAAIAARHGLQTTVAAALASHRFGMWHRRPSPIYTC